MAMNPLQMQEMAEIEQQRADREGFRVHDISSADWCMRKLSAIEAKRQEYEVFVEQEIERLQSWFNAQVKDLDEDASFFRMHLTGWHAQLLEEDPEHNKSVKLPHGTLKSRTVKPQPKKLHEGDLLQHIKDAGLVEYVKVVESVNWAEYKKDLAMVEQDGQMIVVDQAGHPVPGVQVDMGGTTYSVEVND